MTIDRDALARILRVALGAGLLGRPDADAASAALANLSGFPMSAVPVEGERERIEQSNDIAYTVIEVAQNKTPDQFVTLDFRYGIADALWAAGYRKVVNPDV